MIGSYSQWFIDELSKRVLAERVEKSADLAAGVAPDYAAYQYGCGFVAGLAAVLEIADDIVRDVDKG